MIRPDYDYLDRIRRAFSLQVRLLSDNMTEGDFRSVFRGGKLDFDDLKEYAPGDDVRDIDWHASSRTDKILIRRYISDRRLSVLFVLDSGPHMLADTSAGEAKDELALMTFGSMAYLLGRQGCDYAACFPSGDGISFSAFSSGPSHLEHILYDYSHAVDRECDKDIQSALALVPDSIHRRMAVFVVTDTEGLAGLDERVCKMIAENNELFVVHLEDAYLTGDRVYDARRGGYIPGFLSRSRYLRQKELEERAGIYERASELFKHVRAHSTTIRKEAEITDRLPELFNSAIQREKRYQPV